VARGFFGWFQPPNATPVEPPLISWTAKEGVGFDGDRMMKKKFM